MNSEEVLSYYASFPVFNPKDVVAGKAEMSLDGIKKVLSAMGNPQNKCQIIHVAGTNGKGSTTAFLHQIFQENGYKVGVFNSPMVDHFTEQIQINHQDISLKDLAFYTTEVAQKVEDCGCALTSFETLVCVAYAYFYQSNCDVVLMEVGLGGIQDATNVMEQSLLSIITSISFDHMEVLGNTLAAIAEKKAGIIKESGMVLSSQQASEVDSVLEKTCQAKEASLHRVKEAQLIQRNVDVQIFAYEGEVYTISLLGTYQIQNASLALEAISLLEKCGWSFDLIKTKQALAHTYWPDRFEIVHRNPDIIVDGSHNLDGFKRLRESLETYYPKQKVTFVMGVLADKKYEEMFQVILPLAKRVYCVNPDNPRALYAEKAKEIVASYGVEAKACTIVEAIDFACQDELVCIFGSLYYVGSAKKILQKIY